VRSKTGCRDGEYTIPRVEGRQATLGQLSVEGLSLPRGRIAKLCPDHGYAPLFAILVNFIYKTLFALTKTEANVTPAFMLLSRIFLSAIVFQRSGGQPRSVGNGPMLQEDSLTVQHHCLLRLP